MKLSIDKLSANAEKVDHGFVGQWRPIRFRPDLGTGEILNIGVMVSNEDRYSVLLAEDFRKMKCLYDNEIAEQAEFISEQIRELEAEQKPIVDFGGWVELGEPQVTRSESIEAAMHSLLMDVVPLARLATNQRVASIGTQQMMREVFQIIRQRIPLEAERIIRQNPMITVEDYGKKLDVHAPLAAFDGGLGTIVSAKTKTSTTLGLHLYQALTDMELLQTTGKSSNVALFVGGPSNDDVQFSEADHSMIDRRIEEIYMKSKRSGLKFEICMNDQEMADAVVGWATR